MAMRDRGVGGSPGRAFRALLTRWGSRGIAVLVGVLILMIPIGYFACLLEVPTNSQAVLISKIGQDLKPDMELAPDRSQGGALWKGIQREVLTEGRYFYNPINWDWEIKEQFLVPQGKIGVRISLAGDELPNGQTLAEPGQKGVMREVLKPGRYSYNWYAEEIRTYDPVTIPAGFRGVVTHLAGSNPKEPNKLLVDAGERGVLKESLAPGTYYLNPFEFRVSMVDCRSQRYDLSEGDPMEFLSADGFPIVVDGSIEFRVVEEKLPEVFVLYNEDANLDEIKEELIAKIVTPESRSICRINGSKLSGGAFISGDERQQFEQDLIDSLKANCLKQGVEIVSVTITSIQPPQAIAAPIRAREVSKQQLAQFKQEKLQQDSEAQLKVEKMLAEQKKSMVEAEQQVVEKTTLAKQSQAVSKTLAEQKLAVAKLQLEAAKNQASAKLAAAKAAADVIRFQNKAEVAGIAAKVQAFNGDGDALARNMLVTKIAPAYRTILSNTEGPLMELFAELTRGSASKSLAPTPAANANPQPNANPRNANANANADAGVPAFAPSASSNEREPQPATVLRLEKKP